MKVWGTPMKVLKAMEAIFFFFFFFIIMDMDWMWDVDVGNGWLGLDVNNGMGSWVGFLYF